MDIDEEEYREFKEFQKWKKLRKKASIMSTNDGDTATLYSDITYQNGEKVFNNSTNTNMQTIGDTKSMSNVNMGYMKRSQPGQVGNKNWSKTNSSNGNGNHHFAHMPNDSRAHQPPHHHSRTQNFYPGNQTFNYMSQNMPQPGQGQMPMKNMNALPPQCYNPSANIMGPHYPSQGRYPYPQQHKKAHQGPQLRNQLSNFGSYNNSGNNSGNSGNNSGNSGNYNGQNSGDNSGPSKQSNISQRTTPSGMNSKLPIQPENFYYDLADQMSKRTKSENNDNEAPLSNENASNESKENSACNSQVEKQEKKDYKYGPYSEKKSSSNSPDQKSRKSSLDGIQKQRQSD